MKTLKRDWNLYREMLARRQHNYHHASIARTGLDWNEPIIGPKASPATGKGRIPTTRDHARLSGFFGW